MSPAPDRSASSSPDRFPAAVRADAGRGAAAPSPRPIVAVTGAGGFIGRHLVVALAEAGWLPRLLMRREPDDDSWRGLPLQVVAGSLAQRQALERLVDGAAVVIHAAGLIKAARRAEFYAVNRDGSVALADAVARVAPLAQVVHFSTLAAREPLLSDYAGSKRAGEEAMRERLGARVTVLRPPVVYGPGDRETLLFFRLARAWRVPLLGPPEARAALIHVRDLVGLVERLARAALDGDTTLAGAVWTAADERPAGYRWDELLGAAARALGRPQPRFVRVPQPLLGALARAGDAARLAGVASMLGTQKLRELRHADWSVSPAERARPAGWRARYDLDAGFRDAAAWYRRAGWLPA
jgi:nucleoside-diphosphate-sugar epimerase